MKFLFRFNKKNLLFMVLVLLTILIFSACGKIKISVSSAKLFEIQLSGCNGHGKAEFVLNQENVDIELDKYKENKNYSQISQLLNGMTFELADKTQQGKLSNNQDFTVIAKYDETLAENAGVIMEDTELVCTARNLTDGQELDAFQNLKVTFSGENGEGKIEIDSSKCSKNTKEWIEFSSDKKDKLSNGDEVKISAKSKVILEEEGYFLKDEYKIFIVEDLLGPRNSLDGIDTENLREEMNKEMNNKIQNSYYINDYEYNFSSGKVRDLSSEYFSYDVEYELEKYQYVYSIDDLSTNSLIAYYKVTATFKCKSDQSSVKKGATAMKKGQMDTGTTYVAILTNPLRIGVDNQLDKNNYIYFDSSNGKTIDDVQKNLHIGMYNSEYFDKNFYLIEKAEPETEPPTEKSTKVPTEKVS